MMATSSPPQLFLLADHIKLSLLERQRAVSLNLPSSHHDAQISRDLDILRAGIRSLESQVADVSNDAISSQLPRLRSQLAELESQSSSPNKDNSPILTSPNNPSLAPDFAAAASIPSHKRSRGSTSKTVRFTDTPSSPIPPPTTTTTTDHNHDPNRAHLFPYRDDPFNDDTETPPQTHLTNPQLHTYHQQVLRSQDEQLDRLGQSIGRQREISLQIGDELDGHAVLLDDVEEGVDRHAAQFRRARGRLDRFSKKARENWSLSVIAVLIVVLVLAIAITK